MKNELGHNYSCSDDWFFVGEGGATIVFRYAGKISYFKGKILRIPKFHAEIFSQTSVLKATKLGLYVDILERLSFDLEWISLVLMKNNHFRDDRRIQILGPDWAPPIFGYLQLDYHNHMDFSIEIKPKWHGALSYISKNKAFRLGLDEHLRLCRFCNHNYSSKYNSQNFQNDGRYCPLDLFSAEKKRIHHSLKALYRRPSNNFKIFIANRGLPKPEEIPTYLEIASEILCKDVFLSIFSNFLDYLWSIDELSERSDESILLAACIRDSSFVICVDLKSEKYLIRLIDYDGKKKSSVGKYRTERIEMHNIYRSFLNL